MTIAHRIEVAAGRSPADLVLRGGRVANVMTGELEPATVLIAGDVIAALLPPDAPTVARDRSLVHELDGAIIAPSLIDAHMHIESTLLMPGALADIIVPRGTGAVIADPHEIGNVLGIAGIDLMLEASEGLPLDCFFMAPSCVPASLFERSGAELGAEAIAELLTRSRVIGLAEMMNFPGVLAGDDEVCAKIAAAQAAGLPVDGHAPGVRGRDLVAYAAAGISSDHECTDPEEALERDRLGMLVQVREGSMARNLEVMLPLIADGRLRNWALCTDDILPGDLLTDGHLDGLLRRVVAAGVDPVTAIRHASLVPARHYGLAGGRLFGNVAPRGVVAPGYAAHLALFADVREFACLMTIHGGRVVASEGRMTVPAPAAISNPANTLRVGALTPEVFRAPVTGEPQPVILVDPVQITTKRVERTIAPSGWYTFDPSRDLAMVACVQRHRGDGACGVALAEGFGFQSHGAIATSVGHDAHNLMIAGTNAADMQACAEALTRLGGGMVAIREGSVMAELPLPVAGLMSLDTAERVLAGQRAVEEAAKGLGIVLPSPFGTLSFLPLTVIPELRITDQGLFDVTQWALV